MDTDWAAHYKKMEELGAVTVQNNLKALISALKEENVSLVEMTYSGGGDSGEYYFPIYTVGEKRLEDASGYGPSSYTLDSTEEKFAPSKTVTLFEVNSGSRYCQESKKSVYDDPTISLGEPVALAKAVYTVMEGAVESRHGGWYNNDGGEGKVTLRVEEGRLEVSHGSFYTETEWDEYSFSLQ